MVAASSQGFCIAAPSHAHDQPTQLVSRPNHIIINVILGSPCLSFRHILFTMSSTVSMISSAEITALGGDVRQVNHV